MSTEMDFRSTVIASEAAKVLPAYLTRHFSTRGDTFGRLAELMFALLDTDQDTLICRLHAALPDSFAPRFITHYASACLAAKDNDVFGTYRELCHAVRIGAAGRALFSNDPGALKLWYCALQQAFAIDPKHPALISSPPALPFHHAEPSMPVVFSSCNGEYFERFGPEFLASAAPLDGLRCHIHVVNPTRETDALFAACKTRAAAELSYSSDEGPKDPSYYACKRFLLAGEIMDRSASDIIVTDIDTILQPALLRLPQIAGDVDGGMFERPGRTAPMEICHCSLTLFRHTETSRRLLQLLPIYLSPKLRENGVWMLDQCSLFTLTRLAAKAEAHHLWAGVAPLRWMNLSSVPGASLLEMNPNQNAARDVAEKHALRGYQAIGDIDVRITSEGRPIFVREEPVAAPE